MKMSEAPQQNNSFPVNLFTLQIAISTQLFCLVSKRSFELSFKRDCITSLELAVVSMDRS